ncbi:DUF1499 domain-containing protein [Hoeflea sp. G2-23]|uniref:DUF1499 domain-containing protein n=1 Tax=Hoeflea algicola TaxID=2983763 RepID=A0ABT3Z882_9HYPH|nr:DUF1499 domain-containing protein [Hoeflea algicola]MCY0147984.1 DUF1499 domain-containing protein [Hoeflea algicola]
MIKTILWGVAALIGIIVLAFVLVGRGRSWELIAGSPDRGQYDFAAAPRSSTANDALACSPGMCAKPDFNLEPVNDAPAAAISNLVQKLLASDDLARRVDDGNNPATARIVTYSPTMRFPDVIHLEARPLADGRTGLMAYSAAQLGKSDFGVNRARLQALFDIK